MGITELKAAASVPLTKSLTALIVGRPGAMGNVPGKMVNALLKV